ncbi:glycoside hydrolase family 3 protein, partial [Nocardia otitidiscaviarum]
MRIFPGIVLAMAAVVLTACSGGGGETAADRTSTTTGATDTTTGTTSTAAQQDCAAGYLAQFTLRQKLAQLITVGVTGAADAESVVRTEQVGGIFVGGWTDKALLGQGHIDAVLAASRTPLMVTVDEEGGRVSRLRDLIGSAPSARVVAQTMSVEEYYQLSLERGRKMKALGITVDFAPDVDVSS